MKKIRVGILFGGRSAEHEISLLTAKNVAAAIDKEKYEVILIGIDKSGRWLLPTSSQFLLNDSDPKLVRLNTSNKSLTLLPYQSEKQLMNTNDTADLQTLDVIFPLLHGPYGEDGTIQGLCKLANIPFVGASVLGSAIGMDKDVMKRLLKEARISVANFLVFKQNESINFKKVKKQLGLPFFVKPANLGSSIGISKVHTEEEFRKALRHAFMYDRKLLIEQAINGREIECSVFGNTDPVASLPGEVVPTHVFYDYQAKYIDENGAKLEFPARLPKHLVKTIQKLALKTFQTLCCEGMARVDFFLDKNNKLYVNEINTIPGFTKISMYPKLWELSGIPYSELIDRLITLAIERHQKEQKLQTTYSSD